MVGYIHGISPPKLSKKNSEYSNFKFQSKNGVVPGVCFSSTKRSILAQREATKTAVKLERFNYMPDAKTIFVNDVTKISVPNSSEYNFQFVDNSTEQMYLLSITKNLTDVDLVNFVAKVIAKDVDVEVVGSTQLRKTECFVANESLKRPRLVLWENDIEKVLVGNVYAFKNIRVRSDTFHASESEVILNTTKDTTVAKLEDHALVMLVETLSSATIASTS